jgi:uncharacterized repeat protein (TIGR01451 family)
MYTLLVRNHVPDPATDARVSDAIPPASRSGRPYRS